MLIGLERLLDEQRAYERRYFDYRQLGEWSQLMGGGSAGLFPRSLGGYLQLSRMMPEAASLYINGADVLDGAYSLRDSLQRLALARFVARAGCPVTLTGFSLRKNLPGEIITAFRRLPQSVRLCARDPETHQRLCDVVDREAIQVADLAFLMEPAITSPSEQRLLDALEAHVLAGRRLVGICFNLHSVQLANASDSEKADWIVKCLCKAWGSIRSTYSDCLPVVLPHDFRGEWNDLSLGIRFLQSCGLDKHDAIIVEQASAPAIKAYCSKLNLLITGRMHCGIAALGSGVPTVFFDYQGKVEGLLKLFGLNSAISTDRTLAACAERVVAHVNTLLDDEQSIRQRIGATLPKVMALARDNFDSRIVSPRPC
jgi:polysaccharide pyruvyl transferase WcaK-like protein